MVELLLSMWLLCVVGVIVALAMRISALEAERKALLDRLLVANSIMPITPPATPLVKKDSPAPQKVKFKLYP